MLFVTITVQKSPPYHKEGRRGGLQSYDFKAIKLKTVQALSATFPCKKGRINFNNGNFLSFAEVSIL